MDKINLENYFAGYKGAEKGRNYDILFLGDKPKKTKNKYLMFCNICDTPIYSRAGHIFNGMSPCRCSHRYSRTDEKRLGEIINECDKLSFLFDDEWIVKSTYEKFEVECKECHNTFKTSLCQLKRRKGCPYCIKHRAYTEEERLEMIESRCNQGGFVFKGFAKDYVNCESRLFVQCGKCNYINNTSVGNFLRKESRGCPKCAKNRRFVSDPCSLYLLEISGNGEDVFYKIGVAKDIDKRINNLRRSFNSAYNVRCVESFEYPHAYFAYKHETHLKNKYKDLFVFTKEDFPDGYTEIFKPNNVDKVAKTMVKTHSYFMNVDPSEVCYAGLN